MKINLDNLKFGRIAVQSDQHAYHNKEFLYCPRGFKNREENLSKIREDWKLLKPDDILISLGDFALNADNTDVANLVREIPCRTLFLFGNHPSGIKQMYDEAVKFQNPQNVLGVRQDIFPIEIEEGKYILGDQFFMVANKRTYFCSHFAPLIWDKMKYELPALFGHSHSNCPQLNPEEKDFGKMLDCGVENAIKHTSRSFFWLDEIDKIMKSKPVKIYDHH